MGCHDLYQSNDGDESDEDDSRSSSVNDDVGDSAVADDARMPRRPVVPAAR